MSRIVNTASLYLSGGINLNTATIKGLLVDITSGNWSNSYLYLSDIPNYNTLPVSNNLDKELVLETSTYSTNNGVFLSSNRVEFPTTDTTIYNQLCLYIEGPTPEQSPLISRFLKTGLNTLGLPISFSWGSADKVLRYNDKGSTQLTTSDFYRSFRFNVLNGSLGNILENSVVYKLALVSSDYVQDYVNHQYYSSVSAFTVATSAIPSVFANPDGKFYGNTVFFENLTGPEITQAVIYIDTGDASTSPLICRYRSGNIANIPYTPVGQTVAFRFNNNGMFNF